MIQLGLRARFRSEAFENFGIRGKFVAQAFERHFAFQQNIHGAVDHAHSAGAQFRYDPVLADLLAHGNFTSRVAAIVTSRVGAIVRADGSAGLTASSSTAVILSYPPRSLADRKSGVER